jgi:hypothetical protein
MERFTREIQPVLQAFTVSEIAKACACSPHYASLMKKGERVPHPVFYEDLEKLIYQKSGNQQ